MKSEVKGFDSLFLKNRKVFLILMFIFLVRNKVWKRKNIF